MRLTFSSEKLGTPSTSPVNIPFDISASVPKLTPIPRFDAILSTRKDRDPDVSTFKSELCFLRSDLVNLSDNLFETFKANS